MDLKGDESLDHQDNGQEGGSNWLPILEVETGVGQAKLEQLDHTRADHRYLQGVVERIKNIESLWLSLLEKNFAPDVMSQFAQLIREESKLAEANGFTSIHELTIEVESTLLSIGEDPASYSDSIRAYMDSCVNSLNRTTNNLIEEAIAEQALQQHGQDSKGGSQLVSRVYILDREKQIADDLAIELKGHGFKVFTVMDWPELKRLCRLQAPIATLVVLNEQDSDQDFIEKLRAQVRVENGAVPCYVLSKQDTPTNRAMVASSGANSFIPLPCFVPALAAELHSIKAVSLQRPMSMLLVGDPSSADVQSFVARFDESQAEFLYCERLTQLPYIVKEKSVDLLLLIDNGDEKLLTRCLALVGQDQMLRDMPLAVMLKSFDDYADPMMRLITLSASDVFPYAIEQSILLVRLQSRVMQVRRQRFVSDYLNSFDLESGLMLRQAFYLEAEARGKNNAVGTAPFALIYVRLDFMREVIETVGVARIGAMQKELAHHFISVLSPDDLITSLGDNEYLIFAKRDDAGAYRQIESAVKAQVEQFVKVTAPQSKMVARTGVSLMNELDILKNVSNAIEAISIQQNQDKPEPKVPTLTQSAKVGQKGAITKRIKKAMEEERLSLLFQPIVSMEGDGLERYEVLMRMNDAGKLLSPAEFLPEETPANVHRFLDRWVVNRALRVMKTAISDKHTLKFFIKLSSQTICDKSFISWMKRIFETMEAPAERCVFELKENTLIEHFAESQAFINYVREMGACISVANFGAKPQSLKLLDYIDVDYLKLEKQYLGSLGSHDERDLRLDSILDKANQMEVSTLAGFVETTSNLSLALHRGVALFQGNFLQPPQEDMDFDFSMAM